MLKECFPEEQQHGGRPCLWPPPALGSQAPLRQALNRVRLQRLVGSLGFRIQARSGPSTQSLFTQRASSGRCPATGEGLQQNHLPCRQPQLSRGGEVLKTSDEGGGGLFQMEAMTSEPPLGGPGRAAPSTEARVGGGWGAGRGAGKETGPRSWESGGSCAELWAPFLFEGSARVGGLHLPLWGGGLRAGGGGKETGRLTWAGLPCRGAGLVWARELGSWDGQQAGGEGVKGQRSL